MIRLICLTTALALSATSAFGQAFEKRGGTDVYFRSVSGATAEGANFVDALTRALDKSRSLQLIPAPTDDAIELEAPIKFVKEADGRRVTVSFEVGPISGSGRVFTATCTATQLERCADAVVQRTERIGREMKSFEGVPGGLPD